MGLYPHVFLYIRRSLLVMLYLRWILACNFDIYHYHGCWIRNFIILHKKGSFFRTLGATFQQSIQIHFWGWCMHLQSSIYIITWILSMSKVLPSSWRIINVSLRDAAACTRGREDVKPESPDSDVEGNVGRRLMCKDN